MMGATMRFAGGDTAEAIWRAAKTAAPWQMPLFRAVTDNQIRLVIIPPGKRIPLAVLDTVRFRQPLVVVISADAGEPHGPNAFPQTSRLMRWASFIVLHGAGGERAHYEVAVAGARAGCRVLFVEAQGAMLPAWVAAKLDTAPRTPGIVWRVPDGQPGHPCEGGPA